MAKTIRPSQLQHTGVYTPNTIAKANGWRNRIIGYDTVDADQLLANPQNWRIHPKNQQDALESVLDTVGWVQDVIVNKRTQFVVDGHMRVALAISREQQVPVKYVDLTEEEEQLILATFDPISALAGTDAAQLDALLQSVNSDNAAVQEMLAGLAEDAGLYQDAPVVEAPDAQIDRAEELQQVWNVQRGQLWIIPSKSGKGEHRLLCGDSTNADDVARVMAGERANAIITDPPYGVKFVRGQFTGKNNSPAPKSILGDEREEEEQQAFIKCIFELAKPHTVDAAPVYMFSASMKEGCYSYFGMMDAGIHVQSQLVWNKNALVMGRADYHWKHEICWYGWFEGQNHAWYGERNKTTVIDADKISATLHPNEKPVELIEYLMENSTQIGNVLFEPFGGGGSLIIAAERQKRLARAIELDPKFVSVILQRMADMGLQPQLAN